MYCKTCGEEINDNAVICPKCGCATGTSVEQKDEKSMGMSVLGFFFPLIGLILYLVWKDKTPLKAKSAGKGASIGWITSFALGMLFGLMNVLIFSQIY